MSLCVVCFQNSCKAHHFTPVFFFLFKENSSSDGGLQASEDEGTVSVQEDDPGKESDADSFGPTDRTTKLLDEAPPKSALKHTPLRRQHSHGQCCKETSTKVLFNWCTVLTLLCSYALFSENRDRSNATLWTPLIWTCLFHTQNHNFPLSFPFSYLLLALLNSFSAFCFPWEFKIVGFNCITRNNHGLNEKLCTQSKMQESRQKLGCCITHDWFKHLLKIFWP